MLFSCNTISFVHLEPERALSDSQFPAIYSTLKQIFPLHLRMRQRHSSRERSSQRPDLSCVTCIQVVQDIGLECISLSWSRVPCPVQRAASACSTPWRVGKTKMQWEPEERKYIPISVGLYRQRERARIEFWS
jgi:hypothetical protein